MKKVLAIAALSAVMSIFAFSTSAYADSAKIGEATYETIQAAVSAATEGDVIEVLEGTFDEGTVMLSTEMKNITIKGAANGASVLKDMTVMTPDGNSYSLDGITFDSLVFDNSNVVLTGWRSGEILLKDITVNNCTFKNVLRTNNEAAFHINVDAGDAVEGFTFTNNVVDSVSGASNSGVYAQLTGNVVFENNVINNVAFRPYVIQITTDDGIADNFVVKGNTFSGSAAGRAQGLGNNDAGSDSVNLVVSNNIFKDITSAQQICYWNFNDAATTVDLSKNYYDIDIEANPSGIYYNGAADSVEALEAKGIYPFYTELNADGTINEDSIKKGTPVAVVTYTDGQTAEFDSLSAAISSVNDENCVVTVNRDVTENITELKGKIVTTKENGVTITSTYDNWIYCDGKNFTIGEGITFNAPYGGLFVYGKNCVINGKVVVDAYYQRYAGSKLTINAPGSLKVTSETFIIRYMDGDAEAGIYINGDDNDETVELDADVIYFYQGMISAKDATLSIRTYWQTNGTDGQGSANLVLDNTLMNVTVNDHNAKATGNSTVTLKNSSTMNVARGFETSANTVVSIDNTSVIAKNGVSVFAASVNGKLYATLEEAIDAANGGTVVLLKDLEQKDGVKITDKNVVIDLNGKTFKVTEGGSTNSRNFLVNGSSNVTIKNGTIIAAGNITSGAYGTVRTEGTANVTLDGLKLYSYRGYGLNIKACAGTTVKISNTDIYAQYGGGIEAAGGYIELNEGVNIEQSGIYSSAAWCSVAIGVNGNGKIVVNDGTYSAAPIATDSNAAQGTWVAYVMSSGGVLEVNGGAFNGTAAEVANAANACGIICADAKAVVNINGGTFNSNSAIFDVRNNTGEYPNPSVKLAGGVFSADPTVSGLYASNLITLADEYEVINKKGTYIVLKDAVLPTATVTALDNDDLTFALNFKADAATAEQLAYYGDWYADFVLTVNKNVTFNANGGADGYLSGQYDEWLENWVNVPFENVTLKANESLKIMEYAAKLMGKPGLKLTYADVYNSVKDFDCGVFFTPEFLAANSDLKVTLELRMYNPENEEESHVIGETYNFVPDTEPGMLAKSLYVEYQQLTKFDFGKGLVDAIKFSIFAGVDTLNYNEVGFDVKVNGNELNIPITTVYDSIKVNMNGEEKVIYASEFGKGVNHIFGRSIYFPATDTYANASIEWTPYAMKNSEKITVKTYTRNDIFPGTFGKEVK